MRTRTTIYKAQEAVANRSEQLVELMTITSPAMDDALRICADTVAITSRGNVYSPMPFGVVMPGEGETVRRAQLVIQNVTKEIGEIVLAARGEFEAVVEEVFRSDPDNPVAAYKRLRLRNAQVTSAMITADLTGRVYANAAWPGIRATPSVTPGLFA